MYVYIIHEGGIIYMVQTEAAMQAYHEYWVNSPIPYSEYIWMVVIVVLAIIALWQARTFVSKF